MNARTGESWAGQSAGLPAPPPAEPHGAPPRRGRWIAPLAALVAAFVLIAGLLGLRTGTQPTQSARSRSSGSRASVTKAVVDVNTSQVTLGADGLHPLGAGSGIVLTSDGEILTNNHVVEGASRIRVTVAGRGPQTATVMGVDPTE